MKKVLVVVLILAMAFALVACEKAVPVTETEVTMDETDAAEAPAEEMTVLTVAIDDTYPPMEYIDDNGELVGFDIEMTKAMAEKMGIEVEFISTGWDGIFAGLAAQQYDCIISSVSMTVDRLESMDFSDPYMANGQVIVVAPGDDSITSMEDLAGKNVGVQFATTADEAADKALESVEFEKVAFDDMTTCLTAMKAGQVDCIVADYAVAIGAVQDDPTAYEISSVALTNEPIAIAVDKGNTELLDKLNAALDEVIADGTLSALSIKYMDVDLTQDIDTELR